MNHLPLPYCCALVLVIYVVFALGMARWIFGTHRRDEEELARHLKEWQDTEPDQKRLLDELFAATHPDSTK